MIILFVIDFIDYVFVASVGKKQIDTSKQVDVITEFII